MGWPWALTNRGRHVHPQPNRGGGAQGWGGGGGQNLVGLQQHANRPGGAVAKNRLDPATKTSISAREKGDGARENGVRLAGDVLMIGGGGDGDREQAEISAGADGADVTVTQFLGLIGLQPKYVNSKPKFGSSPKRFGSRPTNG